MESRIPLDWHACSATMQVAVEDRRDGPIRFADGISFEQIGLRTINSSLESRFFEGLGVFFRPCSGVLFSFLSQRLQRAAPSNDLIEHCMDRLLVLGSRRKDAEVLEVSKHGEQDLVADRGNLQPSVTSVCRYGS
jgi:hypothetical protein